MAGIFVCNSTAYSLHGQTRQNEARGGTVPGMAFIDGFTSRDLRLAGVSLTLSRVTAGLAAERWRADHVV
jgi:hypothetical protein